MLDVFSVVALSLPEWATVVGVPIAIVSMLFAGAQLQIAASNASSAKTAAESAQRAVERTERHLADNHLLLWVPRLEQVARNLDLAAAADNRDVAMVHLMEWRETAGYVRTLVLKDAVDRPELVERLQTAVVLIHSAKDDLVGDAQSTTAEATRHVRSAISEACDRASEIVAERMAYTRRENQ